MDKKYFKQCELECGDSFLKCFIDERQADVGNSVMFKSVEGMWVITKVYDNIRISEKERNRRKLSNTWGIMMDKYEELFRILDYSMDLKFIYVDDAVYWSCHIKELPNVVGYGVYLETTIRDCLEGLFALITYRIENGKDFPNKENLPDNLNEYLKDI